MIKRLRILVLLLILLFVALNTYFQRVYSTDWNNPLRVAVFPINADGNAATESYIRSLSADQWLPIEAFFAEEADGYGVRLERPIRFALGSQIRELPPLLDRSASTPSVVLWSLRSRYWAWRVPQYGSGPKPDIDLFVLFYDPEKTHSVPHSLGLQKGLFAIVHAFASHAQAGGNDTVIAHELLHTLGATDKYRAGDNQPLHPSGFAEPERAPLYPQDFAELMGGRIPLSPTTAEVPESLDEVVVGPSTALEIGWTAR
jgi:hypothetical protein